MRRETEGNEKRTLAARSPVLWLCFVFAWTRLDRLDVVLLARPRERVAAARVDVRVVGAALEQQPQHSVLSLARGPDKRRRADRVRVALRYLLARSVDQRAAVKQRLDDLRKAKGGARRRWRRWRREHKRHAER